MRSHWKITHFSGITRRDLRLFTTNVWNMAARLTDHDDASRDDDEFSAVLSYFDSSYSSEDDTSDDDKPLGKPKETVVKEKQLTYEKRCTATTINIIVAYVHHTSALRRKISIFSKPWIVSTIRSQHYTYWYSCSTLLWFRQPRHGSSFSKRDTNSNDIPSFNMARPDVHNFCFTDQIKFMRVTCKSDAPLHSLRTEISYFSIILTITCNVGLKKGHKLRSTLLHCVYCAGKHYLIAANVLIFAHYFITFGEK